jgi:helix-turn-helix protein
MLSTSQRKGFPLLRGRIHWPSTVLPIDEAAQKFGLHPTTIWRYIRLGYLKKYKRRLDRRTYVDTKELEELRKNPPFEPKD